MKKIIRDVFLVIPTLAFIAVWLVPGWGFDIDLSPGSDYGSSVFFNLIIPLLVIGIAQTVYAIVLITDILRSDTAAPEKKAVYCVVAWFVTMWLYPVAFIVHIVWLLKNAPRTTKSDT